MFELFKIPQNCILNIQIPLEKIYGGKNEEEKKWIDEVSLYATVKPQLSNVTPVVDDRKRYDEIQFFHVTISDPGRLYNICCPIFKQIKYPCILLVQYEKKFLLGACMIEAGKIDYENNLLKSIAFSHWIYPDLLSDGAKLLISGVNCSIKEKFDLFSMYNAVFNKIQEFQLHGLTKAHVQRLLDDMLGKNKLIDKLDNCTPYKKQKFLSESKKAKYKEACRSTDFIWRYDTEDLWYAFMTNEETKRVVLGRRYRDIDDLIYTIDSKNIESDL